MKYLYKYYLQLKNITTVLVVFNNVNHSTKYLLLFKYNNKSLSFKFTPNVTVFVMNRLFTLGILDVRQ